MYTVRVLSLVILCGTGLFFSAEWLIWKLSIDPTAKRYNHLISYHLPDFEEDRYFFERHFSFLVYPDKNLDRKDAGVYLNQRLPWSTPGVPESKEENPQKDLGLSYLTIERFRMAGEDWPGLNLPKEIEKTGFYWLEIVAGYTHWDLDKKSPRSEAIGKQTAFKKLPAPDFSTIRTWVQMYLIWSLERGRLERAGSNTAALSRLLLSTESYHQVFQAFELLKTLQEFLNFHEINQAFPEIRNADFGEIKQKLKRISAYQIHALTLFTQKNLIREIYSMKSPFPDCFTANTALTRPGLGVIHHATLISSMEGLREFAKILSSGQCRLTPGLKALKTPKPLPSLFASLIRNHTGNSETLSALLEAGYLRQSLLKNLEVLKKIWAKKDKHPGS